MLPEATQLIAFGTAAAVSCALTPVARRLAFRQGTLALPNARTKHTTPLPTSGGVAIIGGFLAAIILAGAFQHMRPAALAAIIGGALIIALVGFIDDRIDIPAKLKLLLQFASLIPLLAAGITIDFITNPFQSGGMIALPPAVAWGVTALWVVGVTNAINLIDGLDGLAAGVSAIACLALAVIALIWGQPAVALLCAALAGSALGYLPWNWYPASVLMGDTGAYFLGYCIAAITILGAFKIAAAMAIFVPILVLVVPLFDTVFAPMRRYLHRQPAFKADREHLHHRLLAMGLSEPRVVLFIYTVSAIFGVMAIFMSRRG